MGEKPGFDPEESTAGELGQIELKRVVKADTTGKVNEVVRQRPKEDERDIEHQKLRWSEFSLPYKEPYDLLQDGGSQKEHMRQLLKQAELLGPSVRAALGAALERGKVQSIDFDMLVKSQAYRAALGEQYGDLPPEVADYVQIKRLLDQMVKEIEQESSPIHTTGEIAEALISKVAPQEIKDSDRVDPGSVHSSGYWEEEGQDVVDEASLAKLRRELSKKDPLPVNDVTIRALSSAIEELEKTSDKNEKKAMLHELIEQAAGMMSSMTQADVGTEEYEAVLGLQTKLASMQE